MEVWKEIKGFETLYEVSNTGKVRSVERRVEQKNRFGTTSIHVYKGQLLKPIETEKRYLRVRLSKNGEEKYYQVHRLVAEAFLPNPHNYPIINHKNEDKTDNRVENLEWCTYEYNNTYHDRHIKAGEKLFNNDSLSKKVLQFYLNGDFKSEYPSISEAVRQNPECGVSDIIRCCKGGRMVKGKWVNQNKHKNYLWRYA